MKRRTERIARHSTAVAIAVGLLLAFAGAALARVMSSSPNQHGGPTMTSATGGSTTGGTTTNTKKILVCHFTHSKKHPAHTISVAKTAEPSFLARGDHEGKCTDAELHPATTTSKHNGKSHKRSKPDHPTTTSTTTTGHGNSGDRGNGGGKGK